VAEGLVVSARGPDGIIQGVEAPDKTFCVAVQWHPEENLKDVRIFDALVAEASRYRAHTVSHLIGKNETAVVEPPRRTIGP
jgi:putative glutamine amidotransferase